MFKKRTMITFPLRLFLAIEIPNDVQDSISRFTETLSPNLPDIRWIPKRNLHITIKFLGNVPKERQETILRLLPPLARNFPPFLLSFEKLGWFLRPSGILFLSLSDNTSLRELDKWLNRMLEPFEFPKEKHSFAPHLTIGRMREANALSLTALSRKKPFSPLSFSVSSFALIRSTLTRHGSHYATLKEFPLSAADQKTRSSRA